MRFDRPNIFQKLLTGFFVFFFVAAPLLTLEPKRAEAQMPVAESGIALVFQAATRVATFLTSQNTSALLWKEMVLDPLLWGIVKMIVSQIVRSTIAWINSGFKGTPMFVQDPGAFLRDIADQVAGTFIYGTPLSFLCQPINIRIALDLYYRTSRNWQSGAVCRLSGIVQNVEQFINGNFFAGGWPGFLMLSLDPMQNNYGALLAGQIQMELWTAGNQGIQTQKWSWGKGFFASEECTNVEPGPGQMGPQRSCKTVTPGDIVAQATTFQLQNGQLTLIAADEFNEIVAALLQQLMIQGLKSLQGLTQPGGSGGSGYPSTPPSGGGTNGGGVTGPCDTLLDRLSNPELCGGGGSGSGGGESGGSGALNQQLQSAVQAEYDYQATQQRIVTAANSVITAANSAGLSCSNNASIAQQASTIGNAAQARIDASNNSIQDIAALQNQYNAATTVEARTAILAELAAYGEPGRLKNAATVVEADQNASTEVSNLGILETQITTCDADGNPL